MAVAEDEDARQQTSTTGNTEEIFTGGQRDRYQDVVDSQLAMNAVVEAEAARSGKAVSQQVPSLYCCFIF